MGRNIVPILATGLALTLAPAGSARAQAPTTVGALADRAAIEDMITRYYNNFGGGFESQVAE